MKNNQTAIEGFKAIDFMRETRDKISKEIATMSFEEIKKIDKSRKIKISLR
ncbi:MAG: hypothetical protein GDA51_10630 [Ekhidna sp.]|nr:hypothetical protein [Ekhidna sp.]MBC6426895.1 hypothetical protein [Ekhidna sp.]